MTELELLRRLFGWRVDGSSGEALVARLRAGASARGAELAGLLAAAGRDEPSALATLAALGGVRETYLFRDAPALEAALRTLAARKRDGVRVWCAGCATGEEAVTLAVLASALWPLDAVEVVASDLDPEALAVARGGVYGTWSLRGAPPATPWLSVTGEGVEVSPRLMARLRFVPGNLAGSALPPELHAARFDLVVCRNVLTYFELEAAKRAVAGLAHRLAPGGLLVVNALDVRYAPDALGSVAGLPPGVLSRTPEPVRAASRPSTAPAPAPAQAPAPAVRVAPPPAALREGLRHLDAGDLAAAQDRFEQALAVDPSLALAHVGLALCGQARADLDGARRHAARARALVAPLPAHAAVDDDGATAGMVLRMADDILGRAR